ncbi:MAG: ABC transporter ATP-binding protein [Proteobacteria bacterium]|nr:ABC transporter ATP-binding protein [Pseudomonadota bacterium]MBU1058413.1 ABC transporter ATP-binding protein [Pseudomonadota bacterium]
MKLENVHRTFQVGEIAVHVLRGVDLDIYAGELLIIQGESGSGKSTLMNMIGGIDQPSQGKISFEGQDISQLGDRRLTRFRRDQVGFVFQFYNLVPTLSALENVATATEIAENPMNPAEALDLVGLSERMHHFPAQLSGGEQQRVAMARAIAKHPKLMLCDEPTGALDHENTIMILELLQRLNRETGTTMVMITHAQAMTRMANRIAFIADGKIAKVSHNATPLLAKELIW